MHEPFYFTDYDKVAIKDISASKSNSRAHANDQPTPVCLAGTFTINNLVLPPVLRKYRRDSSHTQSSSTVGIIDRLK
jgi:hypothetical protein